METYRASGLKCSLLTRAPDWGCINFAGVLLWRSFWSGFAIDVHWWVAQNKTITAQQEAFVHLLYLSRDDYRAGLRILVICSHWVSWLYGSSSKLEEVQDGSTVMSEASWLIDWTKYPLTPPFPVGTSTYGLLDAYLALVAWCAAFCWFILCAISAAITAPCCTPSGMALVLAIISLKGLNFCWGKAFPDWGVGKSEVSWSGPLLLSRLFPNQKACQPSHRFWICKTEQNNVESLRPW